MNTRSGDESAEQAYPDITPILTAKARRRRELAALSWEEKVAIIEHMRATLPRDAWKSSTGDHERRTATQTGQAR